MASWLLLGLLRLTEPSPEEIAGAALLAYGLQDLHALRASWQE